MRDDPVVTGLVTRARNGEEKAWDALVERYAPLIWSICRRHRLGGADDAGQRLAAASGPPGQGPGSGRATRVAGHHDPAGMRASPARRAPGTRCRPCAGRRDHPGPSSSHGRVAAARCRAPRSAARGIRPPPPSCQQLITPLTQDPPLPYATISATLNIPAGSIGPNRGRCLDRLRRDPAITALISAAAENPGSQLPSKRLHSHDEQPMDSTHPCDTGNAASQLRSHQRL
jgi:hypothetical protein